MTYEWRQTLLYIFFVFEIKIFVIQVLSIIINNSINVPVFNSITYITIKKLIKEYTQLILFINNNSLF